MENLIIPQKPIVSSLFLFFCTAVTTAAIGGLIYHATNIFYTTDAPVYIFPLTVQKKVEFGGNPVKINIGLSITNFRKFDMIKDDFIFDGILTFSFEPGLISLDTLNKVTIERGEILYRSEPNSYLWQGKMYAHYNIRAKFYNSINYSMFPLDDHRLNIVFVQQYVSPTDFIFTTKNSAFVVGEDMSYTGWYKVDQRVEVGYVAETLDQNDEQDKLFYPAAIFSIDYGRKNNVRNSLILILPMLLLFFVALFSVTLDPEKNFSLIISISLQALIGLLAFRFVMESMSPQTGYFLYSDYFFFLFLVLIFMILLFNALGRLFGSLPRKVFIVGINSMVVLYFFHLLWI